MRLFKIFIYIIFFPVFVTIRLCFIAILAGIRLAEKKWKTFQERALSTSLKASLDRFSRWYDQLWDRPKNSGRGPINRIFDKRPEPYPSKDRRVPTANLPFGKKTVTYLFEPGHNKDLREVIDGRVSEITERLKKKNIQYLDLTALQLVSQSSYPDTYRYYLPVDTTLLRDFFRIIQKEISHDRLCHILGIEKPEGPCFIKCSPLEKDGKYQYALFFLPETDIESINDALDYYLEHVYEDSLLPQFSKGHRQVPRPGTDPDNDHELSEKRLNLKLQYAIEAELNMNGERGLMNMLTFIFEQIESSNILISHDIRRIADRYRQSVKPSRLLIKRNGILRLIDYQKEVILNPLQLTVYLFFIQRPNGIIFKELSQFRDELYRIYSILTNRTDPDRISKSIDDLANPFSNSMSEKCSKIKEAFIRVIDERWAEPYFITGNRNEPKSIKLNRDLIQIESDL